MEEQLKDIYALKIKVISKKTGYGKEFWEEAYKSYDNGLRKHPDSNFLKEEKYKAKAINFILNQGELDPKTWETVIELYNKAIIELPDNNYFKKEKYKAEINSNYLKRDNTETDNSNIIEAALSEFPGDEYFVNEKHWIKREWSQKSQNQNPEVTLHPFIDFILNCIRKRNEKGEIVEEFILPVEFIPGLKCKLKSIKEDKEKREVLLSLFAFGMMVVKQGWYDNAKKIKGLGKFYGELYYELQDKIKGRMEEKRQLTEDIKKFYSD